MNESKTNGGALPERLRSFYLTDPVTAILERAVRDAQNKQEVCGLLGGTLSGSDAAIATGVNYLRNISILRGSFAVDVHEFLRSKEALEASGLIPLAIFHSHPNGSTRPSHRDTKLPWLTGLLSLILAEADGKISMECYGGTELRTWPIPIEFSCLSTTRSSRNQRGGVAL